MRVFFGGQIKQDCRGGFAVVVSRDDSLKKYDVFLYPINSREFVHLTGVRAVSYPLDRAYIGVSHDAGQSVIRETVDRNPEKVDLGGIDRLVVPANFLDSNPEKPLRIVLESTRTGYKVVEGQ
jgi:hypothetical protein